MGYKKKEMYKEVQIGLGGLDFGELINNNNIKLMQFIGLKDKNGKEIYEGDIILEDLGYNWEIKFNNGAFKFGMYLLTKESISKHKVEVIGNVFENPKLLEEKE